MFDICKTESSAVNKKTLESLILSGACDNVDGHRAQKFESIEKIVRFGQLYNQNANNNQETLFSKDDTSLQIPTPDLEDVEPWSDEQCLSKEKDLIGILLIILMTKMGFQDMITVVKLMKNGYKAQEEHIMNSMAYLLIRKVKERL